MGIVSPAASSILLPVRLCSALPPRRPRPRRSRSRPSSGGAKRPTTKPTGGEPGSALLDHVVGLLHREVALEVLAHHDGAPEARAAVQDRLVVLLGGVRRQVAADQDVGRLVIECHRVLLALGSRRQAVRGLPVLLGGMELELVLVGEVGLDVEHDLLDRAGEREGLLGPRS